MPKTRPATKPPPMRKEMTAAGKTMMAPVIPKPRRNRKEPMRTMRPVITPTAKATLKPPIPRMKGKRNTQMLAKNVFTRRAALARMRRPATRPRMKAAVARRAGVVTAIVAGPRIGEKGWIGAPPVGTGDGTGAGRTGPGPGNPPAMGLITRTDGTGLMVAVLPLGAWGADCACPPIEAPQLEQYTASSRFDPPQVAQFFANLLLSLFPRLMRPDLRGPPGPPRPR